ncbi:MAG: low molecular weight protein tyrosine phosphatase family protein [Acidobacteriota bacterium]|nr:low molecular weight protein tyrosine phosphatase family protein [Acidobacteriota bacterium]
MRILFVCSRNRLRSPTAEAVFSCQQGIEAASAGTSADAEAALSAELIEWAEIIFVMERVHQRKLLERFGTLLKGKQVVVLGIPDKYKYMDPELVAVLRRRVTPYLKPHTYSQASDSYR